MARVKGAVHAKKHHRAVLEQAQGYYGNKSRSFRAANEQVMHSMQYAYRDRRARKGDFRQLWIQRINAAARLQRDQLQPIYRRPPPGGSGGRPQGARRSRGDRAGGLRLPGPRGQRGAGHRAGGCRNRVLSQIGLAYTHQRVRRLRQLLRKRSLRSAEAALVVEGPELLSVALDAGAVVESVYVAPEGRANPGVAAVVDRSFASGIRVFDLLPGVVERVADTVHPQPVLAVVGFAPAPAEVARDLSMVMVLVDVRDPGNAGTMIRTADAAGVGAVIHCDGSVDPTNPKTVRASAGSIFHVPVVSGGPAGDVVELLKGWEFMTVGTAVRGRGRLRRLRLAAARGPRVRQRGLRAGRRPDGRTGPAGLHPHGRTRRIAQRRRLGLRPVLRGLASATHR